jgi:hypothetical protein
LNKRYLANDSKLVDLVGSLLDINDRITTDCTNCVWVTDESTCYVFRSPSYETEKVHGCRCKNLEAT